MTSATRTNLAPYGQRLTQLRAQRGPLCVGVDPHPALLKAWGLTANVAGLERCARGLVEALGNTVAVFKPQSAFFEAYGSAGVAVLERVLADISGARALSLLDVKRGDIGSTMDAYAAAYLTDGSRLAADAVTLSPYLGFDALLGAIELARSQGRGVYVLALTSNPEGRDLQHAVTPTGALVAQTIVDSAAALNSGDHLGHVGIVVGATVGRSGVDFAGINGSILAPGLGAQGASVSDLVNVFGSAVPLVLPSLSREVMSAGPEANALINAARRVLAEMEAVPGLG